MSSDNPDGGPDGEEQNVTVIVSSGPEAPADERRAGFQTALSLLIFAIGLACGVPAALFMPTFLSDYGAAVLSIILGAMLFAVVLMAILFIFRASLFKWMFKRTEVEISKFAGPLADVARHAAEKRVPEATKAARHFAELALSRYAWVSTRRWLIASISGLIAAIAALAGSALLFEQNKLLRQQSGLLVEQNQRIEQQNALIDTDIQLAEAERSAQIGPEVVEIGSLIGAERQAFLDAGNSIEDFGLDKLTSSTRSRIVAATIVARPYRYLAPLDANPRDIESMYQTALLKRPDIVADPSMLEPPQGPSEKLVPRAVSPERGDMLSMLFGNSILQTEQLTFIGADFSFAEYRREKLLGMSLRHALLAFSDFSWTQIVESRFGGSQMDLARFENAVITRSDFSSLSAAAVEEPFDPGDLERLPSSMIGTSFRNSVLHRDRFRDVNSMVLDFTDAAVASCDFAGASLGGAIFRNAILVGNDFSGAVVPSVDLQGAIVFDQAFLGKLAAQAQPGTFVADRWKLVPLPAAEVASHPRYAELTNHVPETDLIGAAWRIEKVAGK
ncbi:MAG: hypothetical protein CML29_13565 [Rhizobiales bacterium]|nr:hypothetical protein [Hyphomicrobiales bacterium]MBA69830.1 hypothetical protein [Hyphomicrobiales bacterium]|tara:strand:+ start:356 stop:2032 length:1677 start_codon:yes stop_codon:yes gene_type:complete